MELTALLQQLVSETPHGLDIALAAINATRGNKMSAQVLNNKLNPYYLADHLNEPQTEAIIRSLNLSLAIAKHYAMHANAVVLMLPEVPETEMDLTTAFMDITRELGEACSKFQEAYSDKRIDRKEFKKIAKEFDDIIDSVVKAKAVVKAVVR